MLAEASGRPLLLIHRTNTPSDSCFPRVELGQRKTGCGVIASVALESMNTWYHPIESSTIALRDLGSSLPLFTTWARRRALPAKTSTTARVRIHPGRSLI